jgi:hypothetical protein
MPNIMPYPDMSSIDKFSQDYQDLFSYLHKDEIYLFQKNFKILMPQNYSEISAAFFDSQIERSYFRELFIKEFGFSVPSAEAFLTIMKYSPLLEIGAGTGYWAHILRRCYGCDIVATDIIIEKSEYKFQIGKYFPVSKISADNAIKAHSDRNVFVSWPTYDDDWAENAIKHIKPGKFLIYVGEGCGGCCASDNFFKILNNDFKEIDSTDMLQFFGLHDNLWVYQKKEKENPVSEYNVMRALEI